MLWGRYRMKSRTAATVLLLTLMLLIPSCGKSISQAEEIEDSQNRAKPIIAAIERYRQDQGMYPSLLQDLVPEYMEAIPKTITGRSYSYKLSADTGGYVLCFSLLWNNNPGCCYLPRFPIWDCSPGGK